MIEDLQLKLNEIRRKLMDMGMTKLSECDAISPKRETIREGLERRKRQYEAQLLSINEAIARLDKVPEFEAVFDAVQRAGY